MKNSTASTIKRAERFQVVLIGEGIIVGGIAGLMVILYRIFLEYAGEWLQRILAYIGQSPIRMAVWFGVLLILAVVVGKLVDYEPLRKQIAVCREDMKNGESFPKALKESHIFGGMQERLMVIGYETGATDEVMEQSADLYQKELQDQIQKMIGILEPTLVGILCVIVGVILLSVMLPLAGIMAGIG